MSTAVFLGPTLPRDEAAAVLPEAHFLPPARAGDLYRAAITGRYEVIVLVDGVFGTVPSVWHKEILDARHRGVRVVGCASMGALRAAECAPFGMVGVGEVFEAYRSGHTEDDDDVAVSHLDAEDSYTPLTVPMVNLRRAFRRGRDHGMLDAEQAATGERVAKRIFYATRTWHRLAEELAASGAVPDPAGFVAFARLRENDAKALDCLAALRLVASGVQVDDDTPTTAAPEETAFWARLRREVEFPETSGWVEHDATHPVGTEERVRTVQGALLQPESPALGRDRRLFVHLVRQAAASLGIEVSPAQVQDRSELVRRRLGLLDAARTRAWLAEQGITAQEWQRALAFEVVVERLAAEYVEELRAHVPLLVAMTGGWSRHRTLADGHLDLLPAEESLVAAVIDAYDELGLPPAPDLTAASRQLGFTSMTELYGALLAAARRGRDEER